MKIVKIVLLFAAIATTISCVDVASNNQAANSASQPGANETSSLNENSKDVNENSATTAETESTPSNSNASTNSESLSPENLVEDLYKQSDNENSPFFQDKNRGLVDKYFAKSLADLIWKDSVDAKGEIGALEFDPLYDAQDTEITDFKVGNAQITGDKAIVTVSFLNFGEEETIKYMLVKESNNWKIENINYGDHNLVGVYKENSK